MAARDDVMNESFVLSLHRCNASATQVGGKVV
jgi:hypothetical protein